MRRSIRFGTAVLAVWLSSTVGVAQTTVLREGAESLVKAVSRYLGKKGVSETGEQIAKYGGKEFAERVAKKLAAEGGEEAVERTARLTSQYGPDVLRAVDNAPSPQGLLNALDDIPSDSIGTALARLAADGADAPLQTLVGQYGSRMVRAELLHPGVSVRLVRSLGDDGLELATKLGRDDAILVAKYADDIAALPAGQREGILRLLYGDTKRMVDFIGRFIRENPGNTLFTGAVTTVVLANSERVLGGDEIVFDSAGNPVVVSKPGMVQRTATLLIDKVILPVLNVLLPIVALGCGAWIVVKVYYSHRRERQRLHRESQSSQLDSDVLEVPVLSDNARETTSPSERSA